MSELDTQRRLSPEARRAHLLRVALELVEEQHGVDLLTPELVADRAGVTSRLTRHYFGTRDGLLEAVLRELMEEFMNIFFGPPDDDELAARTLRYLDWIEPRAWGHRIWTHGVPGQDWLERELDEARRRLAALSFEREWQAMTAQEQLTALGWVAFIESSITHWLAGHIADRDDVFAVITEVGRRLGVPYYARSG